MSTNPVGRPRINTPETTKANKQIYQKAYRARRFLEDEEYRQKVRQSSRECHKRKYQTDPEYREGIKRKARNRYQLKMGLPLT